MKGKREKPADSDDTDRNEIFQMLKNQNSTLQTLAQRSTSGGLPSATVGITQLATCTPAKNHAVRLIGWSGLK